MPKQIDLRHSITALAILQVASLLQGLAPGETMEVLCGGESLIQDLRRVLRDCVVERADGGLKCAGSGCRFTVRKERSL